MVEQSHKYWVRLQGMIKILEGGPVQYRPAWYGTGLPPYTTFAYVTNENIAR